MNGSGLEVGAQRVHLLDLLGGQRNDHRAAARNRHQQPGLLEAADRLTHRAAADAHLPSDFGFVDPLTRLQRAGDDRAPQRVVDVRKQGLLNSGGEQRLLRGQGLPPMLVMYSDNCRQLTVSVDNDNIPLTPTSDVISHIKYERGLSHPTFVSVESHSAAVNLLSLSHVDEIIERI